MDKTSNGRVDIINKPLITPNISNLFKLYDKIPVNQCITLRDPTLGQWSETILSKIFFSKENMEILQNGIRAGVYKKSNNQYVVGQQDCDSLIIIMRSIFLQYSLNQPHNITEQIEELNNMVLNYSISRVYSEAQGYMKYLYDASTLVVPLSAPIYTSQAGKNEQKMPDWF